MPPAIVSNTQRNCADQWIPFPLPYNGYGIWGSAIAPPAGPGAFLCNLQPKICPNFHRNVKIIFNFLAWILGAPALGARWTLPTRIAIRHCHRYSCRFPGLTTSSAKILIYFSYKIYGSNFIERGTQKLLWFEVTKMLIAV